MEPSRNVTVNVTNRTIIRTILWIVAAVLLYKFVGRVGHILTLIFAAFFLALALNPVVSWMSRHLGLKSRVRATAAAYLLVIAFLAVFFIAVIPPLVRQTRNFVSDVPHIVQTFQNQNSSAARAAKRSHLDQRLTQGAKSFASHYNNFGSTVFNTGKRIAEGLASVFAVLVMTFMMLVEGPRWLELIWGTMPERKRQRRQHMAHKMYRGVTGFVNGQDRKSVTISKDFDDRAQHYRRRYQCLGAGRYSLGLWADPAIRQPDFGNCRGIGLPD
jgi:predicted PurR-regulated permease PerM